MIPRAEWRPEPLRRGPVALALGFDRLRGVPVTWVAFGVASGDGFVRDVVDLFFGKPLSDFVYIFSVAGVVFLGTWIARPNSLRERQEPLPFPYYPARVRLARMGTPTGRDEGHVAFVEGWLVFEGERTTFSLSAADVEKIDWEDRFARLLLKGQQTVEVVGTKDCDVLKTELMVWYSRPPAVGLSRLPPTSRHPSARAGMAFGLALAGPLFLGIVVESVLWGGLPLLGLQVLGFAAAFALLSTLLARRLAR